MKRSLRRANRAGDLNDGDATEAGIVGLSQFELCLDILYIGQDTTRATVWVEHSREDKQPWGVTSKIKALYSADPAILDANLGAYRNLSQLKHANPLAGPYGFPMRGAGANLTIQTHPDPDDTSMMWSVVLFCCHKLLEAAAAVKECHSRFVSFEDSTDRELATHIREVREQLGVAIRTSGFTTRGEVH